MGLTGVPLRCTGVEFDVRKHYPYGWYKNLDFDVITDEAGDVEASYRCRIGEVRQSIRMIKQILENLPREKCWLTLAAACARTRATG
jgi:NADH-quinone oxidoreductase subunit D